MGLAISVVKRSVLGNQRVVYADVTFDNSYPTGGEALVAADFGLTALDLVLSAPSGGYMVEYDHTNSKLKAYTPTKAHTHAFTGDALANHTHDLKVVGGASAAGTGTVQVAAGALKKEAATDAVLTGGTDNVQNASAGTPAGTNANNTAAAASEVANTTNLSTVTARVMAIGY